MKKALFPGPCPMELNGALSNPQVVLETKRNTELREKLLRRSARKAPPEVVKVRAGAVTDAVVTVNA